jgi:ABC-2 type transport system ATP-binding protein
MTGKAETSGAAIEIRDLRVDYGDFVAVNDINLSVPYGEVYGLVGPNGAGKTSTFRVLATLMEPTYGEVALAGIDALEEKEEARRILGYMPDLAPVPADLKAWEFLDFYADTHALGTASERKARVDECLEIVSLSDQRNSWCKQLSRGQTQRLVLAKTLLHRPKVMILDEPASGLDPLSRRELRHSLQGIAKDGASVLVSSHILSELAEMCSSLCVMNQGKILAAGTADEVRRELGRSERKITVVVLERCDEIAAWLERQEGVLEVAEFETNDQQITLRFTGDDRQQADLLTGMIQQGVAVKAFEEESSSFEEILVKIAEDNRKPEGTTNGN